MLRQLYDASPRAVRELCRRAGAKLLPFPHYNGKAFTEAYNEIAGSQWYTSAELEQLQLGKLRAVVKHAYENVPHYREAFDEMGMKPEDIRELEDIRHVPIVTKDQIQQTPERFCARNMQEYEPWAFETGGSTGTPLRFYTDGVSTFMESVFVWRFRGWAGYEPADRQAVMRYRTDFPPCEDAQAPALRVRNVLYLSAFHVREANLDDYVARLRKFKPRGIYGFPSTLYVVARHMLREKLPPIPSLGSITVASETLLPRFRAAIEEAFGAKVYNWYGSNECVVTAGECPEGRLHINAEYGLMEVVDARGSPVEPGAPGLVVGTAFNKFAMPFIRYRLGDRVILSADGCPCGRGLPVLESLEGRLDDLIVTKAGRFVGRLDEAFHASFGIEMTQIVQREQGRITVRFVRGRSYADDDLKKLDVELRKRLGADMEIEYTPVHEIPRVGRGKYRCVISELDVAKLYCA